MNQDEVIIAAIQGMAVDDKMDGSRTMNAAASAADIEDDRRSLDWDEKEKEWAFRPSSSSSDPALSKQASRIVKDNVTRQNLGIGGAMTGPKGVIADFKFHERQERARASEKERLEAQKLSATAMKSGWIEREIQREDRERRGEDAGDGEDELGEDEEDAILRLLESEDDQYLKEYRMKRMQEIAISSARPRFGTFNEIDVDQYVSSIEGDGVAESTTVVMHLYQPSHDACRLVNAFLSILAPKYQHTRFLRIVSTKADRHFDDIALPALLVYRGGELAVTLLRISDEISGWTKSSGSTAGGRCDIEDFEAYLVQKKVLDPEDGDDHAYSDGVGGGRSKMAIRAAINSLSADGV
ncbi:Phosducin-like protein 2 [Dinochytrium kinnereticum]|nr:Phosducin-like protein 2 [Dinochytrium kinnereticum]